MDVDEWIDRTRADYVEPPRHLIDAALQDLPTAWLANGSGDDTQAAFAVATFIYEAGHIAEAANWAVIEALRKGLLVDAKLSTSDWLWVRASESLWKRWRSSGDQLLEKTRPAFYRDRKWLEWKTQQELGDAAIRDRWNSLSDNERRKICPTKWQQISEGEQGADTVSKAITKARKEQREK